MPEYTIRVETSDESGQVWEPVRPPETVDAENDVTAAVTAAATEVTAKASGAFWRVAVWDGANADTSHAPAVHWYVTPRHTRRRT